LQADFFDSHRKLLARSARLHVSTPLWESDKA
jgi:hypothetical protein